MQAFPVFRRYHLDGVPWTTIEEGPIRAFARAFLTADAEVWINFDAAKRRMIFIRNPEHTSFDRTVFNTGRRPGTPGAAVGCNGENARLLFATSLAVAL